MSAQVVPGGPSASPRCACTQRSSRQRAQNGRLAGARNGCDATGRLPCFELHFSHRCFLPAAAARAARHDYYRALASSHRVFHPEARHPSQCDLKRFSLGRPRDVTWAGAAIGGASWPPGRAACDTAPCLRLPQATAACVGGGAPAGSACRARQAARCPRGTSSESEAAPAAGAPGGGAGCAAAAAGSVAACCGCGGGSGGGRASAGGPTA